MSGHIRDHWAVDPDSPLAPVTVARRLSRRALLLRAAGIGAGVALAPIVAACSGNASPSPSAASPSAAPPTGGPASVEPTAPPTPEPTPTPAPTPEGELFVYNYQDYFGEHTLSGFQEKYGVKITYDSFDSYETMTAKIASKASGYDVTFATGVDVPGFLQRGLVQPLDLSLIPNRVNLAPEWQDPAYDQGNQHSMPYMWWTTGVAYDTEQIHEELDSWAALWDPRWKGHMSMLDDYREVFGAALIRLNHSINTTSEAELDEALALLQEQKPLLRTYTADDIGVLSSGDVWVAHAWGSDVYQVVTERPSVKYFIPKEGGIRGSDAMVLLAGAPHPVAANMFINYMLDAQVSADNTNFIGYMGPNQAAREFIDPNILADPAVNPDKAALDKLQEILDLGPDLEKYQSRYRKLRSGA